MEESPEYVFWPAELAYQHGVLSDGVEGPTVAAESTLLREGVRDVVNFDVLGVRIERAEANAGKGHNATERIVLNHVPEKHS